MPKSALFDVAIFGAVSCLVVYLVLTLTPVVLALRKAREEAKTTDADAANTRTVAFSVPDFVRALTGLVDALAKAGPVLSSLIGSMLFLLIAAFAAGLFS